MLAQTIELLVQFKAQYPALWLASITTAGLVAFVVLIAEHVKPTGKRRGISGQKPNLPPGPRGLPIIGSMHKLAFARHDPDHTYVCLVSPPCNPHTKLITNM